ncbi:MAG: hypothetical protein QNJ34_17660 [Xenococcaceae cyanobacterium MO_188.B29]|nr:hypothetical protein [Xenococcaceae cyanobacterium MO_188.B29]
MKNNTLIKLFNKQKYSAGYTLTELIIGAGISVVVIGAAGMGLMNLMRGNANSSVQAERRAEVNRALEFISDEVRRAETIQTDVSNTSSGVLYSDLPSGFGTNGEEIVLALNIPDLGQTNPDKKIIYYVKPKPDNTWLGPNVIYRYGPPLDTSGGSYTSNAWVNQALIDRVDDQTFTPPSCSSPDKAFSAKGFAACVESNERIAKIYVNGKFSDSSSDKYKADMQVYARAEAESLNSTQVSVNITPIPTSGGGGSALAKNIESHMGCSPSGEKCSIETLFAQTPSGGTPISITMANNETQKDISAIDPSQTFTVTVTPSTSGITTPFTTTEQNNTQPKSVEIDLSQATPQITAVTGTDSAQVKLLWDGEDVPNYAAWNPDGDDPTNPTFKAISEILNGANSQGISFIQNEKITLPKNQYLLVFEIGQSDTTHKGFDLQDKVILITIE